MGLSSRDSIVSAGFLMGIRHEVKFRPTQPCCGIAVAKASRLSSNEDLRQGATPLPAYFVIKKLPPNLSGWREPAFIRRRGAPASRDLRRGDISYFSLGILPHQLVTDPNHFPGKQVKIFLCTAVVGNSDAQTIPAFQGGI